MDAESQTAWHPDRSWVDPLISMLALLALLASAYTLWARQLSAKRPLERAGLPARLMEVVLAGPRLLTGQTTAASQWTKAERQLKEPWDQALLAVLKAELNDPKARRPEATPAGAPGERFLRTWLAAYGDGPLPDQATRTEIHRRLGGGYAADLLEARLRDREGGGEALRTQARSALRTRVVGLGLLSGLVLALAAGGLALGIYLLVTLNKAPARPLPSWSMSGRAAAVVLLTWFLAFFLSGNLAALLLSPWPSLRWVALPLGYLMQAAFGVGLICKAEGITFATLWRRLTPGRTGPDLAWGGAFVALAVFLVIAVALIASPILKPSQSAQRELQDLLRGLSGLGPTLALFLTVAGLAPFFEELLCRGFLLPILARKQGMALALLVSALLFGAMHLQPAGLPTLCTLGWALGLAMRQTGSLRTPILLHACWNGCLFLLMRAFA
ncbi:CPBP family intramembrane glutamic endopeptidase [Geothrix sp. PMB-07]|uniref:CPBP family intramembrane glutamic endopeptidase n=1 Tax=Geothrix sp. PMB-07 TaxID=3068640 RepID=UPI002740B148|nr:type II CAAX endopeptidase family protein [Geothrix sp. PMB-07]WLT31510.1 type II CAAX endopeptidase family protein [Geothrix sp. PMB-07]